MHFSRLTLFSLIVAAMYLGIVVLESAMSGVAFNALELDPAGRPPLSAFLRVSAVLLGCLLCFVLPGAAWTGQRGRPGEFLLRAFLLSLLLHTLFLSAVKLFAGVELTRGWLLVSFIVLILPAMFRKPESAAAPGPAPQAWREIGFAVVFVGLVFTWFAGKIFVEDFTGDGFEHFEFARSLKTQLLPYWWLGGEHWGVRPNFMLFAWPSLLSILSIGEIEAAVRVPALVFLFFLFLVVLEFRVDPEKSRPWSLVCAAAGLWLIVFFSFHYASWHPMAADIAEPSGTDLVGTFFVVAAVLFQARQSRALYLACALAAAASVQFGAVLLLTILAARWLLMPDRRRVLVDAGLFVALAAAALLLIGLWGPGLPGASGESGLERLSSYWSSISTVPAILFQLYLLVLMTGGLTLLALRPSRSQDGLAAALFLAAWIYSAVIMLSPVINPHYFIPPAVLFLLSFTRLLGHARRPAGAAGVYLLTITATCILVAPRDPVIYEFPSQVGSKMKLEAVDYDQRIEQAEVALMAFPWSVFGLAATTLDYYSARGSCETSGCDYRVAASFAEKPGYKSMAIKGVHTFYQLDAEIDPPTNRESFEHHYCSPPLGRLHQYLWQNYKSDMVDRFTCHKFQKPHWQVVGNSEDQQEDQSGRSE